MKQRKKLSNSFHAFLGGTLKHVMIKLLGFSLLTGIIMRLIGWTPQNLIHTMSEFLKSLWKTGFITFTNLFHMTVMGAIIVIPIFLLSRIFRKR
ncbi:DUF6460 domain-containing protein [Bartonella raoultii]|uniref:DUF6460 domain-containing protein n=1 Tax=Bartonella raoultii TaxID=1457020 RepID=A0ABS7I6W1_9HYPH|nr:DUF6460 domain-containing protein [Bartonella raoultii]MBX4335137.1 hypothetical protein [Bartonella raoultii]